MSRLVKIVMTRAQADQLLWYIDRAQGPYYGNKVHFMKRQKDLIDHLWKGISDSESDRGAVK